MSSAPSVTNIPVRVPGGSTSPAPAQPALRRSTIAGSLPGAGSVLGRIFSGTPGRMRLFGLIGIIAALALGASSVNALLSSRSAVERAAVNTEQVVRVQSIQVDLLRADALATSAFLIGGLESPASRASYEQAMSSVASNIAAAAAAQPADGRALGTLSAEVQAYAALVEQARSNNRLGLPIGAQYLREASSGLRADAIPVVSAISEANRERATDEFERSNSSLWLFIGAAGILVLVAVAVWLARRTHRYINAPLTAGIALLLVALVLAAATISGIANATRNVEAGDYERTVTLATMRTAANDARANESLTLIARGSGATFEAAWKRNEQTVTSSISRVRSAWASQLRALWGRYVAVHQQVRELDDSGQWEQAVKLATSAETTSAATFFGTFDAAVTGQRDTTSNRAVETLQGIGGPAPIYAIGVGLGTLVACWLIARGLGQRIREYQ